MSERRRKKNVPSSAKPKAPGLPASPSPRLPTSRRAAADELEKQQAEEIFTPVGASPVPGLTLRHVLRGHRGWIGRIAWSPDGRRLASPSSDGTIRIWDAASGTEVRAVTGYNEFVYSVDWSPDGNCIASASFDKTARVWEVASGKQLHTIEHSETVVAVSWSADAQLATGSVGGVIQL